MMLQVTSMTQCSVLFGAFVLLMSRLPNSLLLPSLLSLFLSQLLQSAVFSLSFSLSFSLFSFLPVCHSPSSRLAHFLSRILRLAVAPSLSSASSSSNLLLRFSFSLPHLNLLSFVASRTLLPELLRWMYSHFRVHRYANRYALISRLTNKHIRFRYLERLNLPKLCENQRKI